MNNTFKERVSTYFEEDANKYLEELNKPCTQGFFINTKKAPKQEIFDLIDFQYQESNLNINAYYHNEENIGKTKAYELGLIYPQEIAASLTTSFVKTENVKLVVDMCAAPGGKTIDIINRLDKDCLVISNDVNHTRVLALSQNIERSGFDNCIVTNKQIDQLTDILSNKVDLVILDAPCSGEGMIRKYPEIFEEYSLDNINNLAKIQADLLENAYRMLKGNGQLIYSTCTYAFEEDERQVTNFLNKHTDMHLIDLGESYASKLKGTIKLSPLNNTEGQFISLMVKDKNDEHTNIKYLKPIKEKLVNDFIKENIDIDNYYLYKHNDYYYLSLIPLLDLGSNVIKPGIQVGQIINKRFEPSHNLYRSNNLKFKYVYDLSDDEYDIYITGNELKVDLLDHYYQITYKNHSLGFGKVSQKHLKNKYPKGLRRV